MKPEKWREKSDDELQEEMRGLSDEKIGRAHV